MILPFAFLLLLLVCIWKENKFSSFYFYVTLFPRFTSFTITKIDYFYIFYFFGGKTPGEKYRQIEKEKNWKI